MIGEENEFGENLVEETDYCSSESLVWYAISVAWPGCLILFGLYVLFFLISGIYSFLCINPLRRKGRHPSLDYCSHFHPAAVSNAYAIDDVKEFIDDCEQVGPVALKREVQAAILLDSHISTAKYKRVRVSLICFGISAFFGFVYFLLAQL